MEYKLVLDDESGMLPISKLLEVTENAYVQDEHTCIVKGLRAGDTIKSFLVPHQDGLSNALFSNQVHICPF